jgi:hypothetical protein
MAYIARLHCNPLPYAGKQWINVNKGRWLEAGEDDSYDIQ